MSGQKVELRSRWSRKIKHRNSLNDEVSYTVVGVTNTANKHVNHPPQVVYVGDNGNLWSLSLSEWPGSLEPERR